MIELLEEELPMDVTFAFTVQEEVGTRGAFGAAFSVTPELAAELTAVKQSSYPGVPRDAMFRDLIIRGLAAWEKQSGKNSQPV